MSSSSVRQGEPRVLSLKLTPSKSTFSRSVFPSSPSLSQFHTQENNTTISKTNNKNDDCNMESEKAEDMGGWSFLQCLTNTTSQNNTTKETADGKEKVYVHPLVKRSSSKLSEKSLEMCTESLGSETGSLVIESSDDIITTISSTGINNYTSTQPKESNLVKEQTNRSLSFPPPLTSIGGSKSVQVRPHREGGRLVLQAVTISSSRTYFHAERSDGRLRLCLVKDLDSSPIEDDQEEDEEEEEEFDEEVYDDEDEDEVFSEEGEDVEGKKGKVRGEIGIENLPRPSRCKEGGRGAGNKLIWEPFCVAT